MFVSTLAIIGLSFTRPRPHRIFHYITAAITLVASIAYFSMGSDLGQTPIAVEFRRSNSKVSGVNREIFYVRYIDWLVISRFFPQSENINWFDLRVITTPLLLLDLLLTAGLPWPTILFTVLVDEVMIVSGLIGALVHSSYKVSLQRLIISSSGGANVQLSGLSLSLALLPSSGLYGLLPGPLANTP